MMLLLLLTVTLGVAEAGNLFYQVQQQQQKQQPPTDGFLCPDNVSKCPNTATCCQLTSGEWGCCPFASATCCDDNVHCCPNGYTCNRAKEQCMRSINNDTIPWAKKKSAAVGVSSSSEDEVGPNDRLLCPDRTSYCSGTASCCRTYSGEYRCCPYPNNVCCSDGLSCCPRCTICDQLNGRCLQGFETEKWETMTSSVVPASLPLETTAGEKTPAIVVAECGEEKATTPRSPAVGVVWCDTTHYCGNGQTCCRLPNFSWGCCQYSDATCCAGSGYCCPAGKQCSDPPGLCY